MSELQSYLIDIVKPVEGLCKSQNGEGGEWIDAPPMVRMQTYSVLATSAEHALQRFFDEEAGELIYEGEIVERIAIGIELANG